MRLVAIIFTAFVASGPAAAQSWTEYSYPEDLFTISFPGVPKAETTTRQGPDGRVVEARTYSVGQDRGAFKMAIVDLSDPPLDENVALDYAVKTLTQEGEVKLDIPARVNRVYGRQLSIDGRQPLVGGGFLSQRTALRGRGNGASAREPRGSDPLPAVARIHARGVEQVRGRRSQAGLPRLPRQPRHCLSAGELPLRRPRAHAFAELMPVLHFAGLRVFDPGSGRLPNRE